MSTKPSTPFTAREMELINIAFQSLKEKPIIDYELMALKADLVGAKSARDQFNKLYSKLISASGSGGDGAIGGGSQVDGESSPKKQGVGSKKRKAAELLYADGSGAEAPSSTTKKKATTPRKERKKKETGADDAAGVAAYAAGGQKGLDDDSFDCGF